MNANIPSWLKKRLVASENIFETRTVLSEDSVATVCESAACPNITECFSKKTPAFLIMGPECTRRCGFCSVKKGGAAALEPDEGERVALAVKRLGLKYAVITSVTRDDLPDGGAGQFVAAAESIRRISHEIKIELLLPDFLGLKSAIAKIVSQRPDVLGHNIETVRRLYPRVRRGSDYDRSLRLLRTVKDINPGQLTKSGIMLGLGEETFEVVQTMNDLARAGCDIITIGQYLRPSEENLPVERFVPPAEFEEYKKIGENLGFAYVASGPFVRSSYYAEDAYKNLEERIYDECYAAGARRRSE